MLWLSGSSSTGSGGTSTAKVTAGFVPSHVP
jgi:hypothetical protein